jgi:hypothetical protein
MDKSEPLFLATNPEISRPMVITSPSPKCLKLIKRLDLVHFISSFCSLHNVVMYLALIRTRINEGNSNNSISFLIKLPNPSWPLGYTQRSQFHYIPLFALSLHRVFDLDIWSLIWRFSLRSNSRQVTTLPSPPVRCCGMNSRTILYFVSFKYFISSNPTHIPSHNGLWSPSDTSLVINSAADVVEQESKKCFRLLLLQADNASSDWKMISFCVLPSLSTYIQR